MVRPRSVATGTSRISLVVASRMRAIIHQGLKTMGPRIPKDPLTGSQLESKCREYAFDTHVRLVRTLTEIPVKNTAAGKC